MSEPLSTVLADHLIRLQHVGHVVDDLEASIASFRRLYGLSDAAVRVLPDQGAETQTRFAFLTLGDTEVELIQPVSPPFREMLLAVPSGGGGINHVAWRVRGLDAALESLERIGIRPGYVTPDGPVSLPDKRMVYLDPTTTDGLLVELIEWNSDAA